MPTTSITTPHPAAPKSSSITQNEVLEEEKTTHFSMRILYLIGNGFDLHVGFKTSYPDFLRCYLQQPLPANVDDVGKKGDNGFQ